MDFNNLQQKCNEIELFLRDVREYFKSSLETSEYENSSNIFHATEAQTTVNLLQRCEILLQKITIQSSPEIILNAPSAMDNENKLDAPYLDMSGTYYKKKSASQEHISASRKQTYRCSTSLADICDDKPKIDATDSSTYQTISKQIKDSLMAYAHESFNNEEDSDIYDTCVVSQYSLGALQTATSCDDCPFMNLPAGHLASYNSSKYGELQRIEKRLFFNQCHKSYCGIVNDWLLFYPDSNACHPSSFLFLKADIQIEHFGEGKRRDVCFQITTGDQNREKIAFQACNEVDAKEWIHAIEAVKSDLKRNRRLPTPPVMKKITFVGNDDINNTTPTLPLISTPSLDQIDRIYESPIYELHPYNDQSTKGSQKVSEDPNLEFYDTPKSPPKPVKKIQTQLQIETEKPQTCTENAFIAETSELANKFKELPSISPTNSQKIRQSLLELADKIDFQAKVKDLKSQLVLPTSPHDLLHKNILRKTYSDGSNDSSESVALTTSPQVKDQKKQKTSNSKNTTDSFGNEKQSNSSSEKPTKNWFLNRFQKTTSSMRSGGHITTPAFTKCRQSEKENLLNGPDSGEQIETAAKTEIKSKVSTIVNQLEASGANKAIFSMGSLSRAFSDNSDCNTYEPMMTVSSTPNSFLKKI